VMMMVAMDSRVHLQEQNREGRAMCQLRSVKGREARRWSRGEKQIPHFVRD
jgi:hypothetical protein